MRSKLVTSLSVLSVLLFSLSVAGADVPGQVNYQGFLTDGDGIPIDGPVEMLFAIYDQETDGIEVWSEGPMTISVVGGVYNVILGETTPITPALLGGPRWLEVIVGGEYLAPRESIVSSFFAIESMDADTLDSMDSTDFADAGHGHSFTDLTDMATDAQIPDDITISEEDPTVLASVKDGVDWAELSGVPAGFTDGIDNEGATLDDLTTHELDSSAHHMKTTSFSELTDTATDAQIPDDITITEEDPQVGANTENYIPKWDGSALVSSSVYEDEDGKIGIGTTDPQYALDLNGSIRTFSIDFPGGAATYESPDPVARTDTSFAIMKVIQVDEDLSNLTISWEHRSSTPSGGSSYTCINGAQEGSLMTIVSDDYTEVSQVYSSVNAGDFIQIWGRTWTPGHPYYVRNMVISADGIGSMTIISSNGIGIGTTEPTSKLQVVGLPEYADNAEALAGGLTVGAFYRTGDLLKVVH